MALKRWFRASDKNNTAHYKKKHFEKTQSGILSDWYSGMEKLQFLKALVLCLEKEALIQEMNPFSLSKALKVTKKIILASKLHSDT